MEIQKLFITMAIIMKDKLKVKQRKAGEHIIMLMDKNTQDVLLKMKFMDMEDITFYQEHSMKEIGVVA